VIDLDIGKFSDSVRWDLMVKAVQANVTGEQRGIVLCLRRRLAAPIVLPDGAVQARDKGGTPQGSCVSPVPANLVMHYACGTWPERAVPAAESERYADDAAVHCAPGRQAREVLAALQQMAQVGPHLHPDQTRIVSCQDGKRRRRDCAETSRTFPGSAVRARNAPARDGTSMSTGVPPAVSKDALQKMTGDARASTRAPPRNCQTSPRGSTPSSEDG
jgi:hypothetical protein